MAKETWHLKDGTVLRNVHSKDFCVGIHCVIHNPSNHHMRNWPLHWRADGSKFERECVHGVCHPDPDDVTAKILITGDDGWGVHGCCSPHCCVPPSETHL